jgi:hypothetical protein
MNACRRNMKIIPTIRRGQYSYPPTKIPNLNLHRLLALSFFCSSHFPPSCHCPNLTPLTIQAYTRRLALPTRLTKHTCVATVSHRGRACCSLVSSLFLAANALRPCDKTWQSSFPYYFIIHRSRRFRVTLLRLHR